MNQIAFLIDEDIPESVLDAINGVEPSIVVFKIGVHANVPAKGTLDPDLLVFAEEQELVVVSFDKRTMPEHVTKHIAAGRHTCGVVLFTNGHSLSAGRIAEELVFVWAASHRDEWIDRTEYLPY